NRFGEAGHEPLHEQRLVLPRSGICEKRAIDEGKSKVVEMINHIEAILSALDIQGRLDKRRLDDVLQQSAIALCRRASQRTQRYFCLRQIRFFKKRPCEPVRQITGTGDPNTLAFEIRGFCYVLSS